MSNGKDMIIHLIAGLIKKTLYEMSQYFLPYRRSGGNIKVELDLSSYATKTDLKNMTHVDVCNFALKSNLAHLKTEVDELDIAKLLPVPNDLVKLSNLVKNDVKKTVCNKLVTKANNIDTTGFVLKTKYDTDKTDLEKKISDTEKKIPDTNRLVKKTDYNSKITKIEGKIPSISGLVTISALTAVENRIPNVSSLAKLTNQNAKITEIKVNILLQLITINLLKILLVIVLKAKI